jgi:hypothetical protein
MSAFERLLVPGCAPGNRGSRRGRTKTAEIEDSMLGPETLSKVLLLQLQQEERQEGVSR